jgi:hypothetical protein
MNFVEGLPMSNRYDTIMVVIDMFTKVWAFYYFGPSLHSLASNSSLHGKMYKLHGLPDSIIFYRDKIFTSTMWRDLFNLTDNRLIMSSSYHPQMMPD